MLLVDMCVALLYPHRFVLQRLQVRRQCIQLCHCSLDLVVWALPLQTRALLYQTRLRPCSLAAPAQEAAADQHLGCTLVSWAARQAASDWLAVHWALPLQTLAVFAGAEVLQPAAWPVVRRALPLQMQTQVVVAATQYAMHQVLAVAAGAAGIGGGCKGQWHEYAQVQLTFAAAHRHH
jgi:hypothetical protein